MVYNLFVMVFPRQKLTSAQALLLGNRDAMAKALHMERCTHTAKIRAAQHFLKSGIKIGCLDSFMFEASDKQVRRYAEYILEDSLARLNSLLLLEVDLKRSKSWWSLYRSDWEDVVVDVVSNILGYPHEDTAWTLWERQDNKLRPILKEAKEALQNTLLEQMRLQWIEIP